MPASSIAKDVAFDVWDNGQGAGDPGGFPDRSGTSWVKGLLPGKTNQTAGPLEVVKGKDERSPELVL
jgi:hypothetical protein